MIPPAEQRGGSPDLDALWSELREGWPGYYVTDIHPGSWSGRHEQHPTDWWCATLPDSWCVTIENDAPKEERDRWCEWGATIRAAAETLAEHLRDARLSPHTVALGLDHFHEIHRDYTIFRAGCDACRAEHAQMQDPRLEITP